MAGLAVAEKSAFTLGDPVNCRVGCGACCIVPAIDEPYPGHPNGKPAGQRCANLTDERRCAIYDERPASCRAFTPAHVLCGDNADEATTLLTLLAQVLNSDASGALLDAARGEQ